MDARSIAFLALRAIDRGVCLIGNGAVAGGFVQRYPFNQDAMVGTVYFWNFTKPSGIRILKAIMEEFKSHGATHFSCSSHEPKHRIGDYYSTLGLRKAESEWIMNLIL